MQAEEGRVPNSHERAFEIAQAGTVRASLCVSLAFCIAYVDIRRLLWGVP